MITLVKKRAMYALGVVENKLLKTKQVIHKVYCWESQKKLTRNPYL